MGGVKKMSPTSAEENFLLQIKKKERKIISKSATSIWRSKNTVHQTFASDAKKIRRRTIMHDDR